MCDSDYYSNAKVDALRDARREAPEPPTDAEMDKLLEIPIHEDNRIPSGMVKTGIKCSLMAPIPR